MPLPPIVYATFVGVILQESVGRIIFNLNAATQSGVQEANIMLQSVGGVVGEP
jgi:hypothetical protein